MYNKKVSSFSLYIKEYARNTFYIIIKYTRTGNLPHTFTVNEDAYLLDLICTKTYGIK